MIVNSAANINHSMAKIAVEQRFFAADCKEFNAKAPGRRGRKDVYILSAGATSVANHAKFANEVAPT
jgi:hypothetical protein